MATAVENWVSMANLLYGGMASQLIAALAKTGVPAALAQGPKSAAALAGELGLDSDATYRALRGATVYGVLEEQPGQRFALTDLGAQLLPDAPGSLHLLAVLLGQSWHAQVFPHFETCLRTGKSAFSAAHGREMFEWFSTRPEETATFAGGMECYSIAELEPVLHSWDFSAAGRIADIAGGSGTLLAGILAAHPAADGVLFELAEVLDEARSLLGRKGVLDRCQLVAGNFFDPLPAGCDTYLLKHVLHDWHDEKAGAILRRVAEAMTPSSTLLIIEQVVPDAPGPHPSKVLDLFMMAVTDGGRERSLAEHSALLEDAGLQVSHLIPTPGPLALIEARLG